MNPEMELVDFIENENGSATILLDINYDMMVVLARKGVVALMKEAAGEYGYIDTKGAGDAPSGTQGGGDILP